VPPRRSPWSSRTLCADVPARRQSLDMVVRDREEPAKSGTRRLRRAAQKLGAGGAQQHCPFSVAQTVSLKEGLDGPLVIDDCERPRPVRAPQAAIETSGSNTRPCALPRPRLPGRPGRKRERPRRPSLVLEQSLPRDGARLQPSRSHIRSDTDRDGSGRPSLLTVAPGVRAAE
jgi:hypothetical protein